MGGGAPGPMKIDNQCSEIDARRNTAIERESLTEAHGGEGGRGGGKKTEKTEEENLEKRRKQQEGEEEEEGEKKEEGWRLGGEV